MGRKLNHRDTLSGLEASALTKEQWKSWHALSIPDASATAIIVGVSRDPLASEAPAEDQSPEACLDFEADPVFGAAKAPQDIVSV